MMAGPKSNKSGKMLPKEQAASSRRLRLLTKNKAETKIKAPNKTSTTELIGYACGATSRHPCESTPKPRPAAKKGTSVATNKPVEPANCFRELRAAAPARAASASKTTFIQGKAFSFGSQFLLFEVDRLSSLFRFPGITSKAAQRAWERGSVERLQRGVGRTQLSTMQRNSPSCKRVLSFVPGRTWPACLRIWPDSA